MEKDFATMTIDPPKSRMRNRTRFGALVSFFGMSRGLGDVYKRQKGTCVVWGVVFQDIAVNDAFNVGAIGEGNQATSVLPMAEQGDRNARFAASFCRRMKRDSFDGVVVSINGLKFCDDLIR